MKLVLAPRSLNGFPPAPDLKTLSSPSLDYLKESPPNPDGASAPVSMEASIKEAGSLGVTQILLTPSPAAFDLLNSGALSGLDLWALVPNFQQFVRDTSHYGTTGAAARRILSMPLLKKLRLIKVSLRHLPEALAFKFELLMNLFLMAEASGLPRPKALFMHAQITDLALSFDQTGIFRIFREIAEGEFGAEAGLFTLNFVRLCEVLQESKVPYSWIAAPFNPRGYRMHPSAEACHAALQATSARVIADNPSLDSTLPAEEVQAYAVSHPFSAATLDFADLSALKPH